MKRDSDRLMAVWKNTHKDYRGVVDGVRTVLVNRGAEGTCLVPLTALTEEEVEQKLPREMRKGAVANAA